MPPPSSHSSPLGLVLAALARFSTSLGDEKRAASLLLITAAGAITVFSAPTMPGRDSFTRLAEVSGDADCDRSLSPCSDD
jgi:hypothetical protein